MLRNMKSATKTIYGLMNYNNYQAIAKRNEHAYIYCYLPYGEQTLNYEVHHFDTSSYFYFP